MKPTTLQRSDPIVHIVDDDAAVRKALALLMSSAHLSAKTYASAQEFLERYQPRRPGCIVLDLRMPGMSGIELQAALAAKRDPIPVIILSGHGDIPLAVRAIKAGAVDFIEKPFRDGLLLTRVRESLRSVDRSHQQEVRHAEMVRRLALLTPREREVMHHLIDGEPNKVIAKALGISTRTVEIHRAHILRKLGVKSLSTLVRVAIAAGAAALELEPRNGS